jgi:hypothetical protein
MIGGQHLGRWPLLRSPTATPEEVAAEPAPFPPKTADAPVETFFADWRRRLNRSLSRRSDSRWEPLTWAHAADDQNPPNAPDEPANELNPLLGTDRQTCRQIPTAREQKGEHAGKNRRR